MKVVREDAVLVLVLTVRPANCFPSHTFLGNVPATIGREWMWFVAAVRDCSDSDWYIKKKLCKKRFLYWRNGFGRFYSGLTDSIASYSINCQSISHYNISTFIYISFRSDGTCSETDPSSTHRQWHQPRWIVIVQLKMVNESHRHEWDMLLMLHRSIAHLETVLHDCRCC